MFKMIDADDVSPSLIEHKCEELVEGGQLSEKYNYIVYHFDLDIRHFWARTYMDDIATVSIFGPFERDSKTPIAGPLDDAILAYFKRRFKKIEAFGPAGYVPIWSRVP